MADPDKSKTSKLRRRLSTNLVKSPPGSPTKTLVNKTNQPETVQNNQSEDDEAFSSALPQASSKIVRATLKPVPSAGPLGNSGDVSCDNADPSDPKVPGPKVSVTEASGAETAQSDIPDSQVPLSELAVPDVSDAEVELSGFSIPELLSAKELEKVRKPLLSDAELECIWLAQQKSVETIESVAVKSTTLASLLNNIFNTLLPLFVLIGYLSTTLVQAKSVRALLPALFALGQISEHRKSSITKI